MNGRSWVDQLYAWVIKRRNLIVGIFKVFFLLQTFFLFVGAWSIYKQDANWPTFYLWGRQSGEVALVFFILASIPGIVRRFGKFNKLVSILMIFRRYIGIATYMFVLIHSSFVRFVPWVAKVFSVFPLEWFVAIGAIAHVMLFSLFITSNDWSVNKLGPWWHKIHNLIYVIVWLIFVHVVLQSFSIWTVLIGVTALAQIASFWYAKRRISASVSVDNQ
jgi:DMSO/TMAO reductase YedYZ heme-binding membrane subunit